MLVIAILEVKCRVSRDKKQLELGTWRIIAVKIINNDDDWLSFI